MGHLLETKNVTKRFGNFAANDKVNFWCDRGVVTSLLGENGAGKSTLMKTIYGMYQPDEGEILFDGVSIKLKSPKEAIALGIQMVHQHFMLIEELTVAENVVMGKEPHRKGIFDSKEAERLIDEISDTYGFRINPRARISQLSVGEKQKVEIIKALYHGAQLLILDEPTAVLTPQETEGLFQVIRKLKRDGKSVIIITHKLHETMEIADEVFVLRHGVVAGWIPKKDTDPYKLTRMMVDHEPKQFKKDTPKTGEMALEVSGLSYKDAKGTRILNETSLAVRSGEIYGIAGIEGNGQLELLEVISGIIKGWSGDVKILGESIKKKSVKEIIDMDVSFVHSDRMDRGLFLELGVPLNVMLGHQFSDRVVNKNGIINYKKVNSMVSNIFKEYQVSPANPDLQAKSFSGGNQQKIIVGREFYRNPKLAVIAHPTRGVDIGVCEIIHEKILELRRNGSAILLITADFDELFRLSDRIGVIYEGRMVSEGQAEEYTPTRLGVYMGGGSDDDGE